MPNQTTEQVRARTRGQSADLDLAGIIEAARGIPIRSLTMQALADRLQVDRSALNHHVVDKTTLLRLVASANFAAAFESVDLTAATSWQQACRVFADGFVDGVLTTGELVDHLWLGDGPSAGVLAPVEALFAQLESAGFTDEIAVRLVKQLSSVCLSHARDVIHAQAAAHRTRPRALEAMLRNTPPDSAPHLHRILDRRVDTYDRAQLDFEVEVFVAGAEAVLKRGDDRA